jgi:hypothetical protein
MTPIQKLRAIIDNLEKFEVDISRALEYGGSTHSFDDIVCGVLASQYDVLYNDGAIAISEQSNYPNVRAYHVFVAAGTLDSVLALQEQMIERALAADCTQLTLWGRLGWQKVLAKHNWSPKLVYMVRDLTPN